MYSDLTLYLSPNFWNHNDDHTKPMSPTNDIESTIIKTVLA
jgi:hypothetical protein